MLNTAHQIAKLHQIEYAVNTMGRLTIGWTSLYYVGFLLGLFLVGTCLWVFFDTLLLTRWLDLILFGSGIGMFGSTILIVHANRRSTRLLLTIISGSLAGVYGFLAVVYYTVFPGYFMFMWLSFGTLLTLANYQWIAKH